MRRFEAFNLTELMVAMAVIGIIVAVVTPTIMKTRPNKNKMMIKKSFYLTEQIVNDLINDGHLYNDKTDNCYDDDSNTQCYWGFDDQTESTYEGNGYKGTAKFAALFKEKLNVSKDSSICSKSSNTGYIGESGYVVCPVFYTSDGIKWDLSETDNAWTNGSKVGTFASQTNGSGIGSILIDVNGDEDPNCTQTDTGCSADDFDQYRIQILANGKLRINPNDAKAIDYATINTSLKDNMQ